jgi:aspartate/glutamate racemase
MKVTIIHTSFVSVETLTELCREIIPEAEVRHIVDDSLLPEVIANHGLTPGIVRRVTAYAQQAESWGADVILNQCSSVGGAAELAAETLRVPYLRIDEPMAEEAVRLGKRIAVVATVASTMEPSCAVIEAAAKRAGKEIEIVAGLVDGALEILMKEKDRAKHNRLVREKVESLAAEVDVIVLAQGSMIGLLPELQHLEKPVLTSPRSGIERVRQLLQQQEAIA